jgi:polyisoprenoid-binding protein YceI
MSAAIRFASAVAAISVIAGAATAAAQERFAPSDHCLAYRATKRVALVRTVEVVGRNCEPRAWVRWTAAGEANIEVDAAVRGFRSGNGRRDRHVAEILDADRHPEVRFRAGPLSEPQVRRLLAGEAVRVDGTLEMGGRSRAVTFSLRTVREAEHATIRAEAQTSFSALGIEVPKVGPGGFVADAHDAVMLLAHLRLDRVEGADRIAARGATPPTAARSRSVLGAPTSPPRPDHPSRTVR